MAKRRAEPQAENGAAETNGSQNGNRKPIKVFSYLIGQDIYVQCSIWERQGTTRTGVTFTTFDLSLRKRYKDKEGQFQSAYSFHASEVYAAVHALQQAASFITELRAAVEPGQRSEQVQEADVPF